MSKPVPILPDKCRHEIRNTHGSVAFFLPHAAIVQAFMFLLAAASRIYNIGIVAYALMPNHLHIFVRPQLDPDKPYDLVEFKRYVNSNFARFLNAYWDDREGGSVFCQDSIGDSIKVLDAESEIKTLTYAELNGVSAGIGKTPACGNGAFSLRKWLTEPVEVSRPDIYFQPRTWEETETLQLCVPKCFEERGHDLESFRELSENRLRADMKRVHKRRKKQGLSSRPISEFAQQIPDFTVYKRSAADHGRAWMMGECRIAKAREYHDLRAFHAWHEDSFQRKKSGEEGVVFPPGTYKAVRRYGAAVASKARYRAPVRRRDECRGLEVVHERSIQHDERRLNIVKRE